MISRFLACVTRLLVVPFTEIGKTMCLVDVIQWELMENIIVEMC